MIHGLQRHPLFELLQPRRTIDVNRYLEFLKRLMGHWLGTRQQAVRSLDDNARLFWNAAAETAWLEDKRVYPLALATPAGIVSAAVFCLAS